MKLLLTSGGVTNPSIRDALVAMLGKPIEECDALCIPTANYGHPWVPPQNTWRFIAGTSPAPMVDLGWRSVGVLELTALPSMDPDRWKPWVREADVLLVDGGDARYLAHWMQESGLAAMLPELDGVWVGVSAGSMVMTPRIGEDFVAWQPPGGSGDRTLGVVDFSIFPHVDHPSMPENTMDAARQWAVDIGGGPAYALDDASAISVVDGAAEVVSEGTWERLDR